MSILRAPLLSSALYSRSHLLAMQFINPTLTRTFATATGASASSSRVIDITSADEFTTKVMKSNVPVVIDFWAEWCGPCRVLGPNLTKVINNHSKDVVLAKVNVSNLEEIAQNFDISAIPTLVGIKGGKPVSRVTGNLPSAELEKFVSNLTN